MQKNEIKNIIIKARTLLTLFMILIAFCRISHADDSQIGKKYKTIKVLYLLGAYDDVANKKLSKETARSYLFANKHYKKSYVAFENEIPVGTIITIIGLAPKPWYMYFNSDHYFVTLEPDMSQGLEVKLPLDSPLEHGLGDTNGLDSELFSPM